MLSRKSVKAAIIGACLVIVAIVAIVAIASAGGDSSPDHPVTGTAIESGSYSYSLPQVRFNPFLFLTSRLVCCEMLEPHVLFTTHFLPLIFCFKLAHYRKPFIAK